MKHLFSRYSLAAALLGLLLMNTHLVAASGERSPRKTRFLHAPHKDRRESHLSLKKELDSSADLTAVDASQTSLDAHAVEAGYRINFTNVSIIEYIRFVAKISGRNFIYQDSDLGFTVTIVSELPTSVDEVTAALLQILRIHGLMISEQGNNTLIYRDASIVKIAPLVLDNQPSNSPYITRVIHLDYLSPDKAKALVTPLLSVQALVDTVSSTRQLILTDISANVDAVVALLRTVDQPFDALEAATFIAQYSSSTALIKQAKEIMAPMVTLQNEPFLLVDQPSLDTIFVVGSKSLQTKALQILGALDQPGTHLQSDIAVLSFAPTHSAPDAILPLAKEILQPIADAEGVLLIMTIQSSANSILIVSTKSFIVRAKEILQSLDQSSINPLADLDLQAGPVEVITYAPKEAKPEALVSVAEQILRPIADSAKIPLNFVVQNATNTIFVSSTRSFNLRVMNLLEQLDTSSTQPNADIHPGAGSNVVEVVSYTPKAANPEGLVALASKILQPIADAQKIPFNMLVQGSTNDIYISSTRAFNIRAIDLLNQLDKPSTQPISIDLNTTTEITFYLPQHNSPDALLPVAEKILNPIAAAEKVPFTMVIQPQTKSIFISSTRDFNLRAIDLLRQLDQVPPVEDTKATSRAVTVEVASYQPQHIQADALLNIAQKIMGPIATADNLPFSMVVQGATNAIFVTSTASFNARVISVLTALDQEAAGSSKPDLPSTNIDTTAFWLYKLQYQTGSQIQASLNTLGNNLQSYGGANQEIMDVVLNTMWIQGTNSLLFTGTPGAIKRMQDLVPQIDAPSRQVYIEVLIIQTTIANSLNFGVQTGGLLQTQQGMNYNFGNLGSGASSSPPTGFPGQFQLPQVTPSTTSPSLPVSQGFTFGSIGNFITHGGRLFGSIGALVQALQTESDTKIIMNPKIVAVDSHQAQVFIGTNTPFTTANVAIQTAQSSTAFNVDYRDIGISLQVTPTLGKGDMITIDLVQEINNIVGANSINGFPTPTTSKLSTNTRVVVPNGYFLVLSGLIQNQKQYTNSGLPCLGGLPFIGGAFSTQSQNYSKNNTIVFLHPRIMDTPCQIKCIGDYEGDEFYMNSKPESCNVDWQTNAFYKSFYRPYESLCNDLPCTNGLHKGRVAPPRHASAPSSPNAPSCIPPLAPPKPPKRPGS